MTPEQESINLNAMQARVLGALMEKELTTPDAYPLTLNSLVLACNQKTSREPVSHYESGAVQHCLRELADAGLVHVEWGSRADRYAQRLTRTLGIDKPVQALLNVMMLRGPQTLNELMSRCQRMYSFESSEAIGEILAHQCDKVAPIIRHLPRQPGQREDRYMHLLCGEPDINATAYTSAGSRQTTASGHEQRIEALEETVALQQQLIEQMQEQLALLLALNIDQSDMPA